MITTVKTLQNRFKAPHVEVFGFLKFLERLGLAKRVGWSEKSPGKANDKRGRPGVLWELSEESQALFKKGGFCDGSVKGRNEKEDRDIPEHSFPGQRGPG